MEMLDRNAKADKTLIFSPLGRKHQRTMEAIFSSETRGYSVRFDEAFNLIKALDGKIVKEREGSRYCCELKKLGKDAVSSRTLHANHGRDKRNNKIPKPTLLIFRSLFEEAGFTPETTTIPTTFTPPQKGRSFRKIGKQ